MHRWHCPYGKPRNPLGILPQQPHLSVLNMVNLLLSAFLIYNFPGSRGCCCLMCFISDVALMYFRANKYRRGQRITMIGQTQRNLAVFDNCLNYLFWVQKKPRLSSETFALCFKPGFFSSRK